ncbi:MAG: NADH-quinone oxidoreductase subunit NuoK [Halodesulfurarchaeum sp.]
MAVETQYYVLLSAAMFAIGVFGLLTRRNALRFLMSLELILNAANVNLIAFSVYWGNLTGQTFSLFVLGLAAAEVAIGIGIVLVLFRNFRDVDVTEPVTMRW